MHVWALVLMTLTAIFIGDVPIGLYCRMPMLGRKVVVDFVLRLTKYPT